MKPKGPQPKPEPTPKKVKKPLKRTPLKQVDLMGRYSKKDLPELVAFFKELKKSPKRKGIKNKAAKDAKCDHWFSIHIRLRDANDEGYCRCIVSGEWVHWTACDAGHFISRGEKATKYHEQNVHAQKRQSNRFKYGEQLLYGKNLDVKYRKGTADKILVLSKQTRRFEQFELDVMGKHYQVTAEQTAKNKGLEIPEYMYKQRYY